MACSPVPACSQSKQQQTGECRLGSGRGDESALAAKCSLACSDAEVAFALGLWLAVRRRGDIANSNDSTLGEWEPSVPPTA